MPNNVTLHEGDTISGISNIHGMFYFSVLRFAYNFSIDVLSNNASIYIRRGHLPLLTEYDYYAHSTQEASITINSLSLEHMWYVGIISDEQQFDQFSVTAFAPSIIRGNGYCLITLKN